MAQARFERMSVSTSGNEANGSMTGSDSVISGDGRYVGFESYASNLAPYDLNGTVDVFVHDRVDLTTVLISTALTGLAGNNASSIGGISADGRLVVFSSSANDLVKFDTNFQRDIFVRDRDPDGNGLFDEGNETTARVNVDSSGIASNGDSNYGTISADGTKIAFASEASNLVSGDTNNFGDVFVHDPATGVTERVSVSSQGEQGNSYSTQPQLSLDGSIVCFASGATNLVAMDKNNRQDIFVRDRIAGTTRRASIRTDGGEANSDAFNAFMSGDGQRIVFWSYSTNLVDGDTNNYYDAFLHDRWTDATTRLSVSESGAEADLGGYFPHISSSGQFVVFGSAATNLSGVETNNAGDVFVLDLAISDLRKVSVHTSGIEGSGGSSGYSISDDGLVVTIVASGFDLIGSDSNGILDLLVRNLAVADPVASWINYGSGWPGTLGVPSLVASADPVMGTTIQLQLGNSLGNYAVGFLLVGTEQISIPTGVDGTLLVFPRFVQPILVAPEGISITGAVPLSDALAGIHFYMQALEIDPGASSGVSFTSGLDLALGQ